MFFLLASLLGCGDGSGTDTGPAEVCADAHPTEPGCCWDDQGFLKACATELEGGAVLTGSFSEGESIEGGQRYRFTWDADGTPQQTTLYLWVPSYLDGVVPPLDVLGTVELSNDGGCDMGGDVGLYGAFVLRSEEGALLLAVGNSASWDLGEVQVQQGVAPPAGEAACEPFPVDDMCFETRQNEWTAFTDSTDSLSLLPGQSGELGALAITSVAALVSGQPTGCTDVAGTATSWLVLPR